METLVFIKDDIGALEASIRAEGDVIKFEPEKTEKIGQDYLIACSENDMAERAHRAEVMKDASRIVIF